MWEGDTRVDTVNMYAPWQEERCNVLCAVDGVCCCLGSAVAGAATLFPASKEHPLNECLHFLAASRIEADVAAEGPDIVSFYTRLGVVVLGIVMDGDCGIDTMCEMLQRPQSYDSRVNIREELHDYLIERIREPWMQEVTHACQEISTGELEAYRSCGAVDSGASRHDARDPNC